MNAYILRTISEYFSLTKVKLSRDLLHNKFFDQFGNNISELLWWKINLCSHANVPEFFFQIFRQSRSTCNSLSFFWNSCESNIFRKEYPKRSPTMHHSVGSIRWSVMGVSFIRVILWESIHVFLCDRGNPFGFSRTVSALSGRIFPRHNGI